MPLNPEILLGYRPAQVQDPSESMQRMLTLRQMMEEAPIRRQMQEEQLRAAQSEREMREQALSDDRAARQFLTANPNATHQQLLAALGPRVGGAVGKSMSEQQEAKYKADKAGNDLREGQAKQFSEILSRVNDEQSYFGGIHMAEQRQLITPEQAKQYREAGWNEKTSAQIKQWGAQAMTYVQSLEQGRQDADEQRKKNLAPHVLSKAISDADAAGSDAITKGVTAGQMQQWGMTQYQKDQNAAQTLRDAGQKKFNEDRLKLTERGQDMTDTRARELNAITRNNKPGTEAENRNWGFYSRATQAEAALSTVDGNGKSLESAMRDKGFLEQLYQNHAPTGIQTEENQLIDQAKRQFIAAYLRRDSGAVISPSEFADADKTFFPQPGNSKAVLAQKAAARKLVIETLKVGAGRVVEKHGDGSSPEAPQQPGAPALPSGLPPVGGTFNGGKVLKVTRVP